MSERRGFYVALDVNFYDHPKVIAAGEKADRLYTQALTLVKRTWSDGFISDAQVSRLGLSRVQDRCRSLADAGLFERDDIAGGWWIHGWLDANRSKAEHDEIVEKRRSAGSKGGKAGKQSAERPSKQSAKQVGQHDLISSDLDPDPDLNPSSTVTPRGPAQNGDDDGSRRMATGPAVVAHSALSALGLPNPKPSVGEQRTVERALKAGATVSQVVDLAHRAVEANPGNVRAYWAKSVSNLAQDVTERRKSEPNPMANIAGDEAFAYLRDEQVAPEVAKANIAAAREALQAANRKTRWKPPGFAELTGLPTDLNEEFATRYPDG